MNLAADMDPEDKALSAYMKWKAEARVVRTLFQSASMQIPPALAKFLGEEAAPERFGVLQIHPGTLPLGFQAQQWIFVPIASLSVRSLALACLRTSGAGMSVKAIVDAVRAHRPGQNDGSIANLGAPLENAGVIERRGDGAWWLVSVSRAPLLHEGACWGEMEIFTPQEVAAYRREAIRMLLRKPENRGGLQQAQIMDQLESLRWMIAPVTKDIVKLDINAMLESNELVRGSTGKVRLREAQEAKP